MLAITIGCPGSGKSTWAEEHYHPGTLRLERDRFRECIFGSRRAYHESIYDTGQRSAVITQAMLSAMIYWPTPSWLVSDTGLHEQSVLPFIWHANRVGIEITLFIFERDWELLQRRNRNRPLEHQVPDDILWECRNKFIDPEAWWRSDQYQKVYV